MVKKYTNYQNKIKFLLDENLPISLIKVLQSKGYFVEHVRINSLIGKQDKEIAVYAKNNNAILVTKDKEFASPISFPAGSHYGLLILRLPFFFKGEQIIKAIEDFLDKKDPVQLIDKRTILGLGKYRMKKE